MTRFLCAAVVLGITALISSPATGQDAYDAAGGDRGASPGAVQRGDARYRRPAASEASARTRAAARNRAAGSRTEQVLSPFDPPPLPRSESGQPQIDQPRRPQPSMSRQRTTRNGNSSPPESRRMFGSTRTPSRYGGNRPGGSQVEPPMVQPPLWPQPNRSTTPTQRSTAPRQTTPGERGAYSRDGHGGANPRMPQRGPRELAYGPNANGPGAGGSSRAPARGVQHDPRSLNSQAPPFVGGRAATPPDPQHNQQKTRDQLRAIQQERLNREAAKLRSEQAKLRAGANPSHSEPRPFPEDGSEAPAATAGDGPLLFGPSGK